MRRTRIAALTAAGAIAAAGTGVAVATTRSDDPKTREDAVIADAAKRLDVAPSELRDALDQAEDAQFDADVKAGRLTQEQADAIKKHRDEAGAVLGGGFPFLAKPFREKALEGKRFDGKPHLSLRIGPPAGGAIELIDTAAKALGISRAELFDRLRDGKSLEEIAKAEGKSLADVRSAVRSELKQRFDQAVENGKLTRKQADDMLSHLSDKLLAGIGDFGLPVPLPPPPGSPWS
jgi:hypothetical protein